MPPQPALVWPLHKWPRETAECFGGWHTTNVRIASCSLAFVCRRLNSHVPHSCWIAEATGCLVSFLLWALVDCECQENQGCCVWSTQVCVSGFSVWGQNYITTKLFQVSKCWTTRQKRYASDNTVVSNVRENGSFCIAVHMRRAAHLWPSIKMLAVWCIIQTNAYSCQHHDIQLCRAGRVWQVSPRNILVATDHALSLTCQFWGRFRSHVHASLWCTAAVACSQAKSLIREPECCG